MRCLLTICLPILLAAEPPREVVGSFLLVGGGSTPPEVRAEFIKRAGGEKAVVLVIPTASADADKADKRSFLDPWKEVVTTPPILLHTRDRKVADSPEFVKPIATATGVWFSGGDQQRLLDTYRDTRTAEELNKLLERGGIIGGTSAGAAIFGDIAIVGGSPIARLDKGFGRLPGIVADQHFLARNRPDRLLGVLKRHPEQLGLGIDESTAVLISGRTLRVIGQSYVLACLAASSQRPTGITVLKAGETADLVALRRAALARAADDFPPRKPAEPIVPKGTLFIGGGGGMPKEVLERFIAACGGSEAKILFIPTAYDDPIPTEAGEVRGLKAAGAKNIVIVHTRDRKTAQSVEFRKVFTDAQGVWFSGGRQWRFLDSYEGTPIVSLCHDVLARGGAIGGTSAGATIQGEYLVRGHPLGNTVMMAEGYERGFAFLPGTAIDQHFFARKRTADMTDVMATFPQYLGIGIDEGTFLIVKGTIAEVVGRGQAAFYDRRKPIPATGPDYETVGPGGRYDLVARRIIEAGKIH